MRLVITDTVLKAIKTVLPASGKDETRTGIFGVVNVRVERESILFECTDGHRLHQASVNQVNDIAGVFKLDANWFKLSEKLFQTAIKAKTPKEIELLEQVSQFPDTDRVIPKDSGGCTIRANAKYMADAYKAGGLVSEDVLLTLPADPTKAPVKLTATQDGIFFMAVVMPMRGPNP